MSGYGLVASGLYECVLVCGFEKGMDPINRFELINVSFDTDYDYTMGLTHKDAFSLMNERYRIKYGYTLEPYAQWAVTCDWYAKRTPKARHYKTPPLTMEAAMQNTPLGDRLREMAMGEGAGAVLLVSADRARQYKKDPVYIKGISFKNAPHYVPNHWHHKGLKIEGAEQYDLAEGPIMMEAAREAYAMANITVEDIDVVQVYDRQAAGIIGLEGLGCFPLGEGGKAVMNGETTLQGKYPTNTDGGAVRFGFASGAKGCVQVTEIVTQLRGEAGERQVPNARIGVCANTGGMFAQVGTVVLSNEL
jgi:acetyl-CoA C-acetyltransferase